MRFLALALALSGCAFLEKAAPVAADVLVLVSDAAQLIATLESLSAAHFAEHPDAKAEAEVARAFASAHLALNTADRMGGKFDEFHKAYAELVAVLGRHGVSQSVMRDGAALGVPKPKAK